MYDREYVEDFHLKMEKIISNYDSIEAFNSITFELENCEDKYLSELMWALNFLRYEPVLNWIEENAYRTNGINQNWGHLAASSNFSWKKAEEWLQIGRPLSLIALDAILYCTTIGKRLNQSPWMREIDPKLIDNPKADVIANRLKLYLQKDSVPRTKNTINRIIENIFKIE